MAGTSNDGTPRERARAQTMDEIVRIGRAHLVTDGAAALSLRAVARDLGVVSSAVYRYVKSRDELLTLLLVAGYDELGDAVDVAVAAAVEGVSGGDQRAQFMALGRAIRTWALSEPATYALLFGSPVPGYAAPDERTSIPGTRVPAAMLRLAADALDAGRLAMPEDPEHVSQISPALAIGLQGIRDQLGRDLPDSVLTRGVLVWTSLFGRVSFEVFGQFGPDAFGDPATLFELHLTALADQLGL